MNYSDFRNRIAEPLLIRKKAAVLLLIEKTGNGTEIDINNDSIVFEKRALTLKSQPGDICLPGGKIEEGETPLECAVRETVEELGIEEENLNIICPLDYLVTSNRNLMYPFLGIYHSDKYNISTFEVHEIVKVKLKDLINQEAEIHSTKIIQEVPKDFPFHRIAGGREYPFLQGDNPQLFYYIGKHTLWGSTALIVKSFLDLLSK